MKSFIYFFQAGIYVKIGFSTNPRRRLLSLQIGCPVPIRTALVISGTRADEGSLHRQFEKHRASPEWFYLHEDISSFIRDKGGMVEPGHNYAMPTSKNKRATKIGRNRRDYSRELVDDGNGNYVVTFVPKGQRQR